MVSKKLFLGIVLISIVIISLVYVISVSVSPTSFTLNEDLSNFYNFTITNDNNNQSLNYTQINMTFPTGFIINDSTIGTGATNTTSAVNGQSLVWTNPAGLVMNQTSQNFWVNATYATPGTYTINILAYKASTGLWDPTSTSVIINDTTAPSVTLVTPASFANYSYLVPSSNFTGFNLTVTDNSGSNNISSCWYNVTNSSGGDITYLIMSNTLNVTFTATNSSLPDGLGYVRFYCNDTNRNINKTVSVNFTIDTAVPLTVNITTPKTNWTNITASSYVLQVNDTTDNDGGSRIASLYFNITNASQVAWLPAVNDTPMSLGYSANWSYSLVINSTFADGGYNVTAYAFDFAGNSNTSLKKDITIDTRGPVITLYSPDNAASAITTAYNFTFNVTGPVDVANCTLILDNSTTNNMSSVNMTGRNGMYNSSFGVGEYTWHINCTDILNITGNSSSRTFSVTTAAAAAAAASTSGGGAAITQYWTSSHILTNEQFTQGYTKELAVRHRMKFTIDNTEHSAGVIALTATTATINVSSTPQTATLNVGDTRRFDVTDDNYYDVQAILNSISNNKADITIKSIHEEVTTETTAEEEVKETEAAEVKEAEEIEARKTALWTLLIIIAVIIIAVIVYLIYKKKKY